MGQTAIAVDGLTKTYVSGLIRRRRVEALRGVSFEVPTGCVFGLLGPNGAGKTTLIKILLGIVRKSGGAARLLDWKAGDARGRKAVGYLPENHRIPRHLSGYTAMEYYGGLSGLSANEVKQRAPGLLERVGIAQAGHASVISYSKGMLQRLGLAQALLHNPQVLILDEPTDGVDPVGRRDMRAIMRELTDEGKTIFINSHLLQEVELVCDYVAVLKEGQLRRIASVDELTRDAQASVKEVRMTLFAEKRDVEQALATFEYQFGQPDPFDPKRLYVEVKLPHQEDIDHCIDTLKTHGISIGELGRRRITLEDAFLDIVTKSSEAQTNPEQPRPGV